MKTMKEDRNDGRKIVGKKERKKERERIAL